MLNCKENWWECCRKKLLIQKRLSSSGLDKARPGCLWWPDLELVAETCSTVLLKTDAKGCLCLRPKHADPYALRSFTLFFHKHTWHARKHENPDSSTNRSPTNKRGNTMNLDSDVTKQMTKLLFFLSLSLSNLVSLLYRTSTRLWETSSTPQAIHEWTAKEKRKILIQYYQHGGTAVENYSFFAWGRSKSVALFCLCWLGLKLPVLHGLPIAGQHQSKWHKRLIADCQQTCLDNHLF